MITTKIEIRDYLAEYVRGKYNNHEDGPVRFPDNLDIYHVIYDLMAKRPTNGIDKGNLEICLPDRSIGKRPEFYNYLSERSIRIIERKLQIMFYSEVHEFFDDNKHREGIDYIHSACLFLNKYGISTLTEDALIKSHKRWRDKCRQRKIRAYSKKSA